MSGIDGIQSGIPILLLKTRSHPIDTYEELLAKPSSSTNADKTSGQRTSLRFEPIFVPVLDHSPVTTALSELEQKLEDGRLKREYGGMIFTSQRAVEAWAQVVQRVVSRHDEGNRVNASVASTGSAQDPFGNLEDLTDFPSYVVGPATERILQVLSNEHASRDGKVSYNPFTRLRITINGAETGNGANLAAYILKHYNQLYAEHWFNYFEAPRLPFIPLLGMSSQNYGRKRLDANDARLRKKPLLFLVGETRRDVIPKTLQNQSDAERIEVDEVEVYRTEVMEGFDNAFKEVTAEIGAKENSGARLGVIVVFSPQGSDIMLKNIGYLDQNGKPTVQAQSRSWTASDEGSSPLRWILVTIGPTTRDYMKDTFGIESDVCAEKPNPESLRKGIEAFMENNDLR